MTTIQCKYNSVLILRAGPLGALVKYTSRLEGNKCGGYRTNLDRISNKYFFLLVSHLRLSQWRDDPGEGWFKPFYCHNTFPATALHIRKFNIFTKYPYIVSKSTKKWNVKPCNRRESNFSLFAALNCFSFGFKALLAIQLKGWRQERL